MQRTSQNNFLTTSQKDFINNLIKDQIEALKKFSPYTGPQGKQELVQFLIILKLEHENAIGFQYDNSNMPVFQAEKKLAYLYHIDKLKDFEKTTNEYFLNACFERAQIQAIKQYARERLEFFLKQVNDEKCEPKQQQNNFYKFPKRNQNQLQENENIQNSQNTQEELKKLEQANAENQKILSWQMGMISDKDIDDQIKKFQFKDEIEAIQAIANDLDHFWIPGGEKKAQAIRDALKRTVKAAIKHKATKNEELFVSFFAFKKYSKEEMGALFYQKNLPSLKDVLSTPRHPQWDILVGKKITQSVDKILEIERKKWIEKQSEDFRKEIARIQHHIDRLNSCFVPGGKKKAKRIQSALNCAIDAALKSEENTQKAMSLSDTSPSNHPCESLFKDVGNFKNSISDNKESLNKTLAIKRYLFFDNKEAKSVHGEKPEVKSKIKCMNSLHDLISSSY